MAKQITFVFENTFTNPKKLFVSKKELRLDSSLRENSVNVVNEAMQQQPFVFWKKKFNKTDSISIHLSNSNAKERAKRCANTEADGFWGIKYSLNKDGSIKMLSGYEPLQADWTLAEIENMVNDKYLEWDGKNIIINLVDGIGAVPSNPFDWINFLASVGAVFTYGSKGWLRLKSYICDYRIRKIVQTWNSNGIRYPRQIREFLDAKGAWRLVEVKKRLKLNDEFAIHLLRSLGYEPHGDIWMITQSKKSISNRQRWVRGEKRYNVTTQK